MARHPGPRESAAGV